MRRRVIRSIVDTMVLPSQIVNRPGAIDLTLTTYHHRLMHDIQCTACRQFQFQSTSPKFSGVVNGEIPSAWAFLGQRDQWRTRRGLIVGGLPTKGTRPPSYS